MVNVPEPECWLHPELEPRRSPIAGYGLFARRALAAGTVVSRLGGRLVGDAELRLLLRRAERGEAPHVDTIAVTDRLHLVLPPDSPNGLGNHSCDPNLWWSDAYTLVARFDIAAGDEVTNDYATSTADPGFVLDCACGSPLCRGKVTGGDWQLAQLHERYGRHWVPALLTLHDRRDPPSP
jgi:uncharacterized protein